MARVIAVTNQKGGVGKTTTCVNLSASLAATKRRVLLVDMDPQGNATMGSGVDKNALELSGYDMLTKRAAAADVIIAAEASGFSGLPKFILSVAASGFAPVTTRLRQASATACLPPSTGFALT